MTTPTLLCLGAGYSARAAAARARDTGWQVAGTSRSNDGLDRLARSGMTPIQFDGSTPSPTLSDAIATATHILVSIAPDPDAATADCDPVLATLWPEIAGASHLTWVGYLSTVGVYGNHDGAWVDETTVCRPVSKRSVARVAAEQMWLDRAAAQTQWRLHIYRLSGIYGPGRNPIARLKAGTARRLIKPGQVFNRIHVDDIAQAVMAGLSGRGAHAVYNVTDNEPAPPQDVITHAAELMSLPVPPDQPFETADLTPMARSFYGENKRVANARMTGDLGITLAHPTYREGLAAIARDL
ncbi:MAG: SDR family oxidoreductase [Pseudomonadota bacterium]